MRRRVKDPDVLMVRTRRIQNMVVLGYIDPGSGSILLQVLIGSMMGMGLYFRQNVMRVLRMFKRA